MSYENHLMTLKTDVMKTIMKYSKNSSFVIFIFCSMLIVGLLTGCSKDDDYGGGSGTKTISYKGTFVASGSSVTTSASGTAEAIFNTSTMNLSFDVEWADLSSGIVDDGVHIHNQSSIIFHLANYPQATTGFFTGNVTLTSAQASDLASGKLYIQIHTTGYPGGEVLATLVKNNSGGSGGSGGGGY